MSTPLSTLPLCLHYQCYHYVYTIKVTIMSTLSRLPLCLHYQGYQYVYTIKVTIMSTLSRYHYEYTIKVTIMSTLSRLPLCLHYQGYQYVYTTKVTIMSDSLKCTEHARQVTNAIRSEFRVRVSIHASSDTCSCHEVLIMSW